MLNCLAVGAGGFLGAVLRYLCSLLPLGRDGGFPVGTLLVNVLGAFAIGLIAEAAARRGVQNSGAVLFLKVGVCGGFTTFSTFSLETITLLSQGKTTAGMLYICASVALCLLGVLAGQWLAQHMG